MSGVRDGGGTAAEPASQEQNAPAGGERGQGESGDEGAWGREGLLEESRCGQVLDFEGQGSARFEQAEEEDDGDGAGHGRADAGSDGCAPGTGGAEAATVEPAALAPALADGAPNRQDRGGGQRGGPEQADVGQREPSVGDSRPRRLIDQLAEAEGQSRRGDDGRERGGGQPGGEGRAAAGAPFRAEGPQAGSQEADAGGKAEAVDKEAAARGIEADQTPGQRAEGPKAWRPDRCEAE